MRSLLGILVLVATATCTPANARLFSSDCFRQDATTSGSCSIVLAGPYFHVSASSAPGQPVRVSITDSTGAVLLSCESASGDCQAGNGYPPTNLPGLGFGPFVEVPLSCDASTAEGVPLRFWCSSFSP
jgi:hypothetical protein